MWCAHWRTDGRYRVTLSFVGLRELRGDTDNYAKSTLDGLNGIAFRDDKQVVELVARKVVDPKGERTEVLIERVGDASARKARRK
jgi:Holliday junction resolvase RusA-like endonuclease